MNKKTKKIAIILITITIGLSLVFLLILNIDVKEIDEGNIYNEIVPEEEITDNQLRETTIKLFFVGENKELKEVVEKVDSKELIDDPYKKVLSLLISKTNEELNGIKTHIPNNTRINSITKNGECLIIDLSKEFIDNMEASSVTQELPIMQIVNTMTQFNEINAIKILIDGSDDINLENGSINFKQLFTVEK